MKEDEEVVQVEEFRRRFIKPKGGGCGGGAGGAGGGVL